MFDQHLLPLVRPRPSDAAGLVYAGGIDADGVILAGKVRSPASGETYEVKSGYLDLLENRVVADNVANLGNFLPGAGRAYEPLWRVHSLTLLTGEPFSMQRELGIISELVGAERGGLYLDLGCSAGLYARGLARALGDRGDVVGIDISPSMLREAARRARRAGVASSFARADAQHLPFADASFSGTVCGGTLNELGDPARALRETRRVLEPGGRLAVMGILRARTPRGRRLQRLLSTGGIRFFAPDQLGSMLHHAGFDPDPLRTHGAVFFAGATRRA
ncbi:MAG: methyltransferase domain-containing protein [Actinomycetota bacterium]|jgi:SAM-dependent methyltransferase|nr:methyltransferase domain-containing protein [Actinomycetota bacterium]